MNALRGALVAIAVCVPAGAGAVPKGKAARTEFDKGVAAYQKHDYAAASAALGRSYALEADTETLFAWAQSERQLGNCDKALELYEKLLQRDLPAANAEAVRAKRDECSAIIASQKKEPEPQLKDEPDKDKSTSKPEAKPERTAEVRPEIPERPETSGKRAWWKDPIGGALVLTGVGGLAAGTVFLMQGKTAENEAAKVNGVDRVQFDRLDERAKSRSQLGVIVGAAGGALLIGGIVRYVVAGGGEKRTQVTGFFDGSSGGVLAFGRF